MDFGSLPIFKIADPLGFGAAYFRSRFYTSRWLGQNPIGNG
jgi:hypothetical protein